MRHAREQVHFKAIDYAHGSVYGGGYTYSRQKVSGSEIVSAVLSHHHHEKKRQSELLKAISEHQGDLSKLSLPHDFTFELYDHSPLPAMSSAAASASPQAEPHASILGGKHAVHTSTQGSAAASQGQPHGDGMVGGVDFSPEQTKLNQALSAMQTTYLSPSLVRAERQYELKALQHDRLPRTATQIEQGQNDLQAQARTTSELSLPGFGIYEAAKRQIFFDHSAIKLLRLSPELAQKWLPIAKLRRAIGGKITHQILEHLRQLRDSTLLAPQSAASSPAGAASSCPAVSSSVAGLAPAVAAVAMAEDPHYGSFCPYLQAVQQKSPEYKYQNCELNGQSLSSDELKSISAAQGLTPPPHITSTMDSVHASAIAAADSAAASTAASVALWESAQSYHSISPLNSMSLAATALVSSGKMPETPNGLLTDWSLQNAALDAYSLQPVQTSTGGGATAVAAEPARAQVQALPGRADVDDIDLPSVADVARTGRSRTTFAIELPLGDGSHVEKLYLKLNALFKRDHSLSFVSITITRVASKLFELMPHIVSDSASFDWLIPTDECIYGRNYYTILGYRNHDPNIPYRHKLWQKTVVHPDDVRAMRLGYKILHQDTNGNAFELLYRSRCRDGSYIWTKSVGMVTGRNQKGTASRVLGINIDINRVLEGYEQLQNKVFTDILTGLRNRTYLITHMEKFIAAATGPLTIIFADVTALKLYNDYLGHAVGDKLLCSAAIIIKSAINRINELIRISGDEIICVLPNCAPSDAALVCHNIEKARDKYNENAPIRMPVFFSIGAKTIDLSAYAGRKLHGEEKEEALGQFYQAIQDADELMQKNKKMARTEHYSLVQAYIEHTLHHPISLSDNRLF